MSTGTKTRLRRTSPRNCSVSQMASIRKRVRSFFLRHRKGVGWGGSVLAVAAFLGWLLQQWQSIEFLAGKRKGIVQVAKVALNLLASTWFLGALWGLATVGVVGLWFVASRTHGEEDESVTEPVAKSVTETPTSSGSSVVRRPVSLPIGSLTEQLAQQLLVGERLRNRARPLLSVPVFPWVSEPTESEIVSWETRVAELLQGHTIERARFLAPPAEDHVLAYAAPSLGKLENPLRKRLDHRVSTLEAIIYRLEKRGL